MTYQKTPGFYVPPLMSGTAAPAYSNVALNAVGEKIAFIMTSPVTDTITGVSFRTATVTTGNTVDVRIETVDLATGDASGTLWGTNTNASQVILSTDDNVWFNVTLTAAASVNAGDIFAIVIVVPASTNMSITVLNCATIPSGFPSVRSMPTVPTWGGVAGGPVCAINFGTNGYSMIVDGIYPFSAITTRTFNNTSTPDVRGNTVSFPYDCKVKGCWFIADLDGDATFKLYGSDGVTVLASVTNDSEIPGSALNPTVNMLYFNAEASLTANTTYRIGCEPSTGTSMSIYEFDFNSSSIKAQYPGGAFMSETSAKDPTGTGSWTDTSTKIVSIGLIVSAIDIPASSGVAVNPMRGFIAS